METKTKLVWKEEDNAGVNNILKFMDVILAFCMVLTPLITSAFCLVGATIDVPNLLLILYCFYFFIRFFSLALNWRFIRFKKPDIVTILTYALCVMIFVTEVINSAFCLNTLFKYGFIITFLTFYKLEKKYYKSILYTFILTIAVCSIMGVCDLNNSYMPGFVEITYPMSLQFWNPNYSAYITVMAIIMTIYVLSKYKSKLEQVVFWIAYVVLNVALFINGCFSAETAMFIGELFLLIYLWFTNKKCPYVILICLGISIASSFAWVKGYSTSNANYMFETLSFLDGKLGTKLTKNVSTFFDKLFGTGIIERVAGSDGWERGDLKVKALSEIFASPKSILFGYGVLYNNNIRVHNVFLQIWLEYGLVNIALYVSIWVIWVVRFIKTKPKSYNLYLTTLLMVTILVSHYFGCLEVYSFTYFMCFVAVFVSEINRKRKALNAQDELILNDAKLDIKTEEKLTEFNIEHDSVIDARAESLENKKN